MSHRESHDHLTTYETRRGWGYQWVREGDCPLVRWDDDTPGYSSERAALDGALADAAETDPNFAALVAREIASRVGRELSKVDLTAEGHPLDRYPHVRMLVKGGPWTPYVDGVLVLAERCGMKVEWRDCRLLPAAVAWLQARAPLGFTVSPDGWGFTFFGGLVILPTERIPWTLL